MSEKAKILPRLEVAIILIFFFSFLIWVIPKCSSTQKAMEEAEISEALETDSSSINLEPAEETKPEPPPTEEIKAGNKVSGSEYSRLFVTINNLKLRTGPSLDSTVVATLTLFEEVFFLNEVTDFKTEINLGYEMATEPWVKIRTQKGREGWVFGAGVNYYKKKREGVLE